MNKTRKPSFLTRNGLSIVLLLLMLLFWGGQLLTGWKVHNEDLAFYHKPALSLSTYTGSGHFLSTTFENWESEFLQMALYVILTVWLYQKGSSESKKMKGEKGYPHEVDREPKASPDAPWPVRKGGTWLKLYSNSLSIAFVILFLFSFWMHFEGSFREYNEKQVLKGLPVTLQSNYITNVDFWFESFQNWQSEFLAVAAIVILSIWLRQKGSPESKPVDAPHMETGD